MKRFMMLCAAVGLLAVVVIAADPVSSVNVVGFNKIEIPSRQFALIAMNFDAFDNTLVGIFGTNQLRCGTGKGVGPADKVYLWDTVLQKYITCAQLDTDRKFYYYVGWPADEATNRVVPGEGFWVQASTSSAPLTLTLMGEVVGTYAETNSLVPGFQMIGFPFTCDIALQDTTFSNGGARGNNKSPGKADKVYTWQTNKYVTYALNEDGKWYEFIGWPATLASNTLRLGEGIWYQRATNTAFDWIETNRYIGNL